jgi:rod shape-determining protein MreD
MILCTFLQSTVAYKIAILGVIPDISLIVLIYSAIKNGSVDGQISGFVSGIFVDFVSSAPLGFNALIRTVLGFLYGLFSGSVFVDVFLAPFLMTFIATIAKAVATILISFLFPQISNIYSFFDHILWVEALYNALLAPLVFLFLGLFKRWLLINKDIA